MKKCSDCRVYSRFLIRIQCLGRGIDEIAIILPDLEERCLEAEILQIVDQVAVDIVRQLFALKKIILFTTTFCSAEKSKKSSYVIDQK